MKIGDRDINFESTLLSTLEFNLLIRCPGSRESLSAIRDEKEWKLIVEHLDREAALLIGTNRLFESTSIWFHTYRSLLFKLHGYQESEWRDYLRMHSHPPSGRLLSLWIIPAGVLQRALNQIPELAS